VGQGGKDQPQGREWEGRAATGMEGRVGPGREGERSGEGIDGKRNNGEGRETWTREGRIRLRGGNAWEGKKQGMEGEYD